MATIDDYRDEFDPAHVHMVPGTLHTYTVAAQPVGGGTPGKAYAGNWVYRVTKDDVVWVQGDDYTSGMPRTSEQTAREIMASVLASIEFPDVDHDALNAWAEGLA